MKTKKRTLVVEDDEDVRVEFRAVLERAGWEVEETKFLIMALRKIKQQAPFDCVVLDLNLPDAKGLTTLRHFVVNCPQVPVVVVTGGDHTGAEAVRLGAMDYLEKPVMAKQLVERVELAAARAEAGWVYQPIYDRIDALTAELESRNPLKDTTVIIDSKTADGGLPPPTKPRNAASTVMMLGVMSLFVAMCVLVIYGGVRTVESPAKATAMPRVDPSDRDARLHELRTKPSMAAVYYFRFRTPDAETIEAMKAAAKSDDKNVAHAASHVLVCWGM